MPVSWHDLARIAGSGGFGDVYIAEIARIGSVAVKRMKASESATALETFEQEALHIFSIGKHENVLQLHGVCVGDPYMMLVTDLCMGGVRRHRSQHAALSRRACALSLSLPARCLMLPFRLHLPFPHLWDFFCPRLAVVTYAISTSLLVL